MKKALLIGSLLSISVHSALHAQESSNDTKAGTQWLGVFGQYYRADEEKFPNIQTYEEGDAYGFEYGYRFSSDWATRIELTKLDIDEGSGNGEHIGESIGIDALYFIDDSETYVFAGGRYQDFYDSRRLAALGLGKHWSFNENWKVITEAAAMHDFGEGHRDVTFKVGLAYAFGGSNTSPVKAIDQDNDGVTDAMDRCANTPMGAEVNAMGCEINADDDKDGVVNSKDMCAATPMGTAVDSAGCAIKYDTDKDGVFNDADQCANTPRGDKVDAVGCSVMVEKEVSQKLLINFASESANIRDIDSASIEALVAFLERFPNTDVMVEGHASAPGAADYNMRLSEERAKAVKTLLTDEYNIDADRIMTKGLGETQLLDTSNTPEAHKKNRRIVARVATSIRIKA